MIEYLTEIKDSTAKAIITGSFIFSLTILGIMGFLGIKQSSYDAKLRKKALIKADTNQDGIIQNTELSDLLKNLNCNAPLPNNKYISITFGPITRMDYLNSRVILGREDTENYLNP